MFEPFHGAKVALFIGDQLLVYLRDEIPSIPFPAYWDLPGGGREGNESPEETVIRETFEEFALTLQPGDFSYRTHDFSDPNNRVYFFAASISASCAQDIRFGDEGQYWELWSPKDFAAHPKSVPNLVKRLNVFMKQAS